MPVRTRIVSLWRHFVQRRRQDRELDAELAEYIALIEAEKVREGLTPTDARRVARIEVGGMTQVKEAVRRARTGAVVDSVGRDVRYAFRALRRSPIVSIVSVVLLALGIGVNAAFFAYLDYRINRPLAGVPDTEGLVQIDVTAVDRVPTGRRDASGRIVIQSNAVSVRPLTRDELLDFQDRQTVFETVGGRDRTFVMLERDGVSEQVQATVVSSGYLATLRVRMALGAPFPAVNDRTAFPEPTVILDHRLWETQFGRAGDVIGRELRVNGVPLAIVGVLPEGFPGSGPWIPLSAAPIVFPREYGSINGGGFDVIARLRPGVTIQAATDAATALTAAIGATHSATRPLGPAVIRPLTGPGSRENAFGGMVPPLATITGFVLLIACANVAILLLGRGAARRSEMAVRFTLGAGRRRLVRQLVTEGVVLAVIGGALGLLVLYWLAGYIDANFVEVAEDLSPSLRTVAVTLGFATFTGLLFAVAPALHATRGVTADALKDGGAGGTGRRRTRLQRTFVVAEVAMSIALVCATGVFVQAVRTITSRDMGLELSSRVLFNTLALPEGSATPARFAAVVDEAATRIRGVRGVEQVAFTTRSMFGRGGSGFVEFQVSRPAGDRPRPEIVPLASADPGYFATIGARIIQGREFAPSDGRTAPRVGIATEAAAEQLAAGEDVVGRSFRFKPAVLGRRPTTVPPTAEIDSGFDITIIGVVRSESMEPGRRLSALYVPRAQLPDSGNITMVVRIAPNAAGVATAIHAALRGISPDLVVTRLRSTKEYLETEMAEAVDTGLAGTALGLLALALACVGVYAVIAFSITQRSREIGIRIALGARPGQVVGVFLREGLALVGLGSAIGAPLGFSTMKLSMWSEFGVEMLTLRSVMSIMVLLAAVALLASWLPARRAARVDPLDAIRSE